MYGSDDAARSSHHPIGRRGRTWQTVAVERRRPKVAGEASFADGRRGWLVLTDSSGDTWSPPFPTCCVITDRHVQVQEYLLETLDGRLTWR